MKYNIKTDSHRKIKSSKSIVTRVGYPIGLRIGNLFWIIGGIYLSPDLTTNSEAMNSHFHESFNQFIITFTKNNLIG